MSDQSNLQRRDVLKGLAATVGASVAVTAASAHANNISTNGATSSAAAPQVAVPDAVEVRPTAELPALFQELVGQKIGRWDIDNVVQLQGSVAVVMHTENGERFQVDVLRYDSATPGVGNSAHMSVYLSNHGDGEKPSQEEHGLGAMELAAALRVLETEHAVPASLLTLRERSARFPRASFMRV